MQRIPYIHATRNDAKSLRFNDGYVWIELADGRVIGMPVNWFPWLQSATEAQRQNYELLGDCVYWEDMDEAIDLVAMLTALYTKPKPMPIAATAAAT